MTSLSNPSSAMSQITNNESQNVSIFGSENNFSLNNYNKIKQNGIHFKTKFELKNIPVAMANALRRSCSSLCPTVTFDDSYNSKSILVNTNTSSLHNEFLTHRLSLIPINMQDNTNISFGTKFNTNTCKRDYEFTNDDDVPVFSINVKNNGQSSDMRDQFGIINVTTDNFLVTLGEDTELDTQHFFPHDVFTNDPVIINKLKYNISDGEDGEEMNIKCFPRIGLGKENARHDPTGTVTYEFEVDTDTEVENVFRHKVAQLQAERISKKLNKLTDTEIEKMHNSFNLLDKQRVYTRDDEGNPNHFKYSVESIGALNPDQIVIDAMTNLSLNIVDVRNSIILNNTGDTVKLESNSKLELNNLTSRIGEGLSIIIKDENHTMGNIVQHYLRTSYLADSKNPGNLLSIASYRMPHPTVEEIEFILVPHKNLNKSTMINEIRGIFTKINENNISGKKYLDINNLENQDKLTVTHMFLSCLFIDAINSTLQDLSDFVRTFKLTCGITESTYSVEDSDEYINHTNNTRLSHRLGFALSPRSPAMPPPGL